VSGGRHSSPLGDPTAYGVFSFGLSSVMDDLCHARKQGVRCPFYGFAWPAGTSRLVHVAGNRCGLALDRVESCAMEEAGREVDMEKCPTAQTLAHFVRLAAPVIAFVVPDHPEGLSYAAWRSTMLQGSNAHICRCHESASDRNSR
jgi:hypothetical protein